MTKSTWGEFEHRFVPGDIVYKGEFRGKVVASYNGNPGLIHIMWDEEDERNFHVNWSQHEIRHATIEELVAYALEGKY
jgi:hypothetical protein